jgi:Peptidase A4 family
MSAHPVSKFRTAATAAIIAAAALAVAILPGHAAAAAPVRYAQTGWAGYVWPTASHTVTASLRLPAVHATSTAAAAFWVGFGTGPGIEQTGFTANVTGGHLSWSSWYELYPAPPVTFGRPAATGDYVSMTVTYRGGGWYTMTLKDTTGHWTASVTKHTSVSTLGIAEATTEAYGPAPAQFAAARFYNLPAAAARAYTLPWAHLSALAGHAFTVSW